ncbi:MAG: uncharacterized protein JWM34_1972 [Ilumatobacteraceae bacterium]|nr:uncharacterized protein [Ilumatobacteraceae bacterium]
MPSGGSNFQIVTVIVEDSRMVDERRDGPFDLEFFYDPSCPSAWQTFSTIRRVSAVRTIDVGWRFLSLERIDAGVELSAAARQARASSLRIQRIAAAVRDEAGHGAVGALYEAIGERVWARPASADTVAQFVSGVTSLDLAELLTSLGLRADLALAADDAAADPLIFAESDEAFRRAARRPGLRA